MFSSKRYKGQWSPIAHQAKPHAYTLQLLKCWVCFFQTSTRTTEILTHLTQTGSKERSHLSMALSLPGQQNWWILSAGCCGQYSYQQAIVALYGCFNLLCSFLSYLVYNWCPQDTNTQMSIIPTEECQHLLKTSSSWEQLGLPTSCRYPVPF